MIIVIIKIVIINILIIINIIILIHIFLERVKLIPNCIKVPQKISINFTIKNVYSVFY